MFPLGNALTLREVAGLENGKSAKSIALDMKPLSECQIDVQFEPCM
jgi:hypothetical protein